MQKRKDHYGRTYWVNPPEAFEQIKRMYPDTVELAELIRKFVVMPDGTINGYKFWVGLRLGAAHVARGRLVNLQKAQLDEC